jgi:cytochrome c551/c552
MSFISRAVGQALLAILWFAPPIAGAANAASASRAGAQLLCSACHVVSRKQKYPPLLEDPAPSFQSIANRTQVSEAGLRHFILTTHWDQKTVPLTMPNPGLSKADTVAVIRYLLSLKGQ